MSDTHEPVTAEAGPKTRVAAVGDIAPGEALKVEVAGVKVALIRVEDDFYALADRCSHSNYSLSEGEVDCDERTLECWKHGALFSLADGEALTLPATSGVDCYPVEVADGEVFVGLPRKAGS